MPVIKIKEDHPKKIVYLYIPYYNMVFRGDVIKTGNDSIRIVKSVRFSSYAGKSSYSIVYFTEDNLTFDRPDYTADYNSTIHHTNFYFIKRPFINWVKYILVLITGSYVK